MKHKDWRVELVRLRDIHLTPRKSYEKEAKGSRMAVRILSVMVVALLLIGWVNALNLTVARYLERGREFGIRKAFGASRRQVILQGLLEAGLLNLSALILALGWVEVLLPFVCRWVGLDFAAGAFRLPEFWSMAAACFIGGTLFTGLYPSFLLTRIRPADIMRGKLLHGRKGNRMRKMLIVAQFLASFVLVSGTLVVIGQVRYMQLETSSASSNRVLVVKYPVLPMICPSKWRVSRNGWDRYLMLSVSLFPVLCRALRWRTLYQSSLRQRSIRSEADTDVCCRL